MIRTNLPTWPTVTPLNIGVDSGWSTPITLLDVMITSQRSPTEPIQYDGKTFRDRRVPVSVENVHFRATCLGKKSHRYDDQ
jgi:hypothetical protein